MKLFVWRNVLTDYTSGMMVAIAENVVEARQQLLAECPYIPSYDLAEEPDVYDTDKPFADMVWGGG